MDELFEKAFAIVLTDGRINYSNLQRKLNITGHRTMSLTHAIIKKLVADSKITDELRIALENMVKQYGGMADSCVTEEATAAVIEARDLLERMRLINNQSQIINERGPRG